jgi:uncharacterized protein (TIGR03067 family)
MKAILAGLTVVLLCGADAVKKELAALEGEWSMVSGERDGQALAEDIVKTGKRVSKDGETAVSFGDTVYMKAKYTIDATKTPKTIDYEVIDGPFKGKKQLGIYKIEDDKATFCFAAPDKDRPTKFESKAGSDQILSVWKKNKK